MSSRRQIGMVLLATASMVFGFVVGRFLVTPYVTETERSVPTISASDSGDPWPSEPVATSVPWPERLLLNDANSSDQVQSPEVITGDGQGETVPGYKQEIRALMTPSELVQDPLFGNRDKKRELNPVQFDQLERVVSDWDAQIVAVMKKRIELTNEQIEELFRAGQYKPADQVSGWIRGARSYRTVAGTRIVVELEFDHYPELSSLISLERNLTDQAHAQIRELISSFE